MCNIVKFFKRKSTETTIEFPVIRDPQKKDELTRSYRKLRNEKYNRHDFIVGYEIHPGKKCILGCDLCNTLAGSYPKSFNWSGWHFDCSCYTTSVLMSENEISQLKKNKLRGEDVKITSANEITDYPTNFKLLGGFQITDKLTDEDAVMIYKKIENMYASCPTKWNKVLKGKEFEQKKEYDEAIAYYKSFMDKDEKKMIYASNRIKAIQRKKKKDQLLSVKVHVGENLISNTDEKENKKII